MEWVKSKVGYYRLIPIAMGSDALEVMFKRGDALAGELGENGFIPDAMLPSLARRPSAAKKLAADLVKSGLWDRVKGGYLIVDFADINAELIKYTDRKKRDRDRKRAERRASVDQSEDASADKSSDSPRDSPQDGPGDSLLDHQNQTQNKKAAAAAPAGPGTRSDLPPAVAILRAALEAHKLVVRWDTLTSDELAEIERLVIEHGDAALVASALREFQPNRPAATAKAWIGGWRDLRPAGDLHLVSDPCPQPGHSGTTRHCTQCSAEQKAATR